MEEDFDVASGIGKMKDPSLELSSIDDEGVDSMLGNEEERTSFIASLHRTKSARQSAPSRYQTIPEEEGGDDHDSVPAATGCTGAAHRPPRRQRKGLPSTRSLSLNIHQVDLIYFASSDGRSSLEMCWLPLTPTKQAKGYK